MWSQNSRMLWQYRCWGAGMIGVKKMMKVNITCDHRIIYGAHAAEFLATLKQVIENPEQLLK
jgi:pyruvate dehydrogenase E2 component (dihydrolipoamide acetyltransferase)